MKELTQSEKSLSISNQDSLNTLISERKGGIFLFDKSKDKFLIVHSSNFAPDLWTIPKGNKESRETYWECARRELKEEVGINIHLLQPVFHVDLGFVTYGRDYTRKLKGFLYVVEHCPFEVNLDWENDKYKWVNTSEARACIFKSQFSFLNKIDNIIHSGFSR